MKINWKVRLRHKSFLVALWALIVALANNIADSYFGVSITLWTDKITDTFEIVLMLLGFLGVIIDPTTKGTSDSDRAMNYDKPRGEE